MTDTKREAPASPEKRAAALEIVLRRKADLPKNFVAEFTELPTMPGLPRTAPRWWLAHGLTDAKARFDLVEDSTRVESVNHVVTVSKHRGHLRSAGVDDL